MIDGSNAFWAGVAGGAVMTVMMAMAHKAGLVPISMPMHLGCMMTRRSEGGGTFLLGLITHLLISGLIALAYAWGFEAVLGGATWLTGIYAALVHWAVGGVMVAIMDRVHPCVRDGRLPRFGPFGSAQGGILVMGFLMGHLVYGAIVGWLYQAGGA